MMNQRFDQTSTQLNLITICGQSRSKCGYCSGLRTDILSTPNPRPESEFSKHNQQNLQAESIAPPPSNSPVVINLGTNDQSDGEGNTNKRDDHENVTTSTSSKAYSILATSIHPNDYQMLLDRGWRRSGDLLYLPQNWECCCPSHPIRLNVNRFKLGKGHKKVLKNLKVALNAGTATSNSCSDGSFDESCKWKKRGPMLTGDKGEVKGEKKLNSKMLQGRKRARNNHSNHEGQDNDETKPTLEHIHQHVRDFISKCNISTLLQRVTVESIEQFASQLQLHDESLNDQLNQIVERCSRYKITKMSRPTNLERYQNKFWKYEIMITLSSTICPALHGASKGKIDKNVVSNAIVKGLASNRNLLNCDNNYSIDSGDIESSAVSECQKIKIDSVTSHEGSGHVNVSLLLTHLMNSNLYPNRNNNDAKVAAKKMDTVISDFMKSFKIEMIEQEPGLHPPFELTVRSIPSRISGRDPKVHRLYAKYQAAIHNDPDPFLQGRRENYNMKEIDEVEIDEQIESINDRKHNIASQKSDKLSMRDFERLYRRYYDDAQMQMIYKR